MNMSINTGLANVVDAAIREIVSTAHRPEGSYVKTPLLYPSGSEVVVRISGGPDVYFVTDFGMGHTEAELGGFERTYMRQAKIIGQNNNIGFDNHAFFILQVDADRLPGAIVTIANCTHEAVLIAASKAAEKLSIDGAEFMIEKLERIFGIKNVNKMDKIIGASNHEWEFAASIQHERKKTLFEFATKHPNSVASVAMKMNDISRLEHAPKRIVMVHNKAEMGTYLGILAFTSNVIEENIADSKIINLASVA